MSKKVITAPPDGLNVVTSATDMLGFHGVDPIAQRDNPVQTPIQPQSLGQIITFACNAAAPANAVTANTAEVAVTFTGVLATDFVLGVNKPTSQAGMGICNVRANANDAVRIAWCNPTAANVVPTTNQTYLATVARGLPVISANLAPSAVVLNSTSEQEFTLAGASAAATSALNSDGSLKYIRVTAGGSGYYSPPKVIITPTAPVTVAPLESGLGLGGSTGLPGLQGGSGATARAVVSGGAVVGVIVTDPGQGYTAAPTISFVGGNVISPGMVVSVNKPSQQNGLGIGNVRVTGPNKVAIQFFNLTAANITPTANETYKLFGFNSLIPQPIIKLGANVGAANYTGTNSTANTTLTVTGLTAYDAVVGVSKPTMQANMVIGGGFCAANALSLVYLGTSNTTPTANEVWQVGILRAAAVPPIQVHGMYLTPTAVAANTTAEQVFTLGANLLTANTTVVVNKQSYQPGLSVVQARANAANELAITFMNQTAANITPNAEVYLFANFQSPVPTLDGYVAQTVSISWKRMLDLTNEMAEALAAVGLIRGY